jgi:guanylate kinase
MDNNLLKKLQNYRLPKPAISLIRNTKMVFMVGITGAGKDSIRTKLLNTGKYHHIVSHTTRQRRKNHGVWEQDGVEYHFIDLKTAENMLDEGGYVEAKLFSGNIYGTSVAEIQMAHDEGKIAISDIEVQGVAEYKAVAKNVIPVFILPPSFQTWQKRIHGRYDTESMDRADIKKRLKTAKQELKEALTQDYFEFVINDDLEKSVRIVDQIAHGHFSDKKNLAAREIAEKLLEDIETAGY